jgi:hypothetical protein
MTGFGFLSSTTRVYILELVLVAGSREVSNADEPTLNSFLIGSELSSHNSLKVQQALSSDV